MNNKNFYLTTTLPYVNADPHIGFALEIVQADVVARYHRLLNENVFFNFGTDEHGLKIYQKAKDAKKDIQKYCDEYAKKFDNLKLALNLSYNNFIRTTDSNHIEAVRKFWKICNENGDIYKKNYKTNYCVGCELEKTDSELVDGKCPLHPNRDLELIEEENYFFKFSKYQKPLLDFYDKNPDFVIPESKYKEIKTFVKKGLKDFSISRLKKKMPWGIEVPGDPEHVIYVWFDALINYISAIGWPNDLDKFNKWWPVTQFAGKDNLRQQTAIWQAMLISAGISNSKQVFIHGFVTLNGQKISKSLGNTIDPIELSNKYGVDALRYFLLSNLHPYEDSDFTIEKFEEIYNADLANGLGNLISRITTLCEKVNLTKIKKSANLLDDLDNQIKIYRFDKALKIIWEEIKKLDIVINKVEPWKITDDKKLSKFLIGICEQIIIIANSLSIFLPNTSKKVLDIFYQDKIKSSESLFPRIK